jgi:hypothetical protein
MSKPSPAVTARVPINSALSVSISLLGLTQYEAASIRPLWRREVSRRSHCGQEKSMRLSTPIQATGEAW